MSATTIQLLNTPPSVTATQTGGDTGYLSALKNHSLMGQAMVTMESIMLLFTELANARFEQMSKKTEVSRDAQEMANRVDALLAGLENAKDKAALPPEVIEYMRANNIQVNGMSIDEFLGTTPVAGGSEAAKFIQMLDALLTSAPDTGVSGSELSALLAFMQANNLPLPGGMEHLPAGGNASLWQIEQLKIQLQNAFPDAGSDTGPVLLDKAALTAVKSALESASGRASDFVQQNQLKLQQLMQNFNTAVTMANSIQSMNAESAKSIAQSIR